MNYVRSAFTVCALFLAFYGGCSSKDERPKAAGDDNPGTHRDASVNPPATDDDGSASKGDGGDGGPTYLAVNCGALGDCVGTQACVQDEFGAYCACDEGYTRVDRENGEGFDCVLDEACKRIHYLYDGCGWLYNSFPVVTSYFSVEYCAGIPVPADKIGKVADAFQVREDEEPIDLMESAVSVVRKQAESFVTIAVDVSDSALSEDKVGPLVEELQNFVSSLEQPSGKPPVTFSVLVFGRKVAEYVAATTSVSAVNAALQAIVNDPDAVSEKVGGDGTALNDAVKEGIQQTERLIALRSLVTQRGVRGTGTLVVVTDGENKSGAKEPDTALIKESPVHIISVGINSKIDDTVLTAVGRDGSFLAPTQEAWKETFADISARILARLDNIYGVAFCSPQTAERHELTVALSAEPTVVSGGCEFEAGSFALNPSDADFDTCQDYIENACDTRIDATDGEKRCGGVLACGSECGPGECCNDAGRCVGPEPTVEDCREQDQLCQPGAQRCFKTEERDADNKAIFRCRPPLAVGQDCSEGFCEAGEAQCLPGLVVSDAGTEEGDVCTAGVRELGQTCSPEGESAYGCDTLNCAKDPGSTTDRFYCQLPARMFDACSGSDAAAVCEQGTYCGGGECKPRELFSCSTDSDCLSGACDKKAKTCYGSLFCHFAWNDVVAN